MKCLQEYANYKELEYYPKKISFIKEQLVRYSRYLNTQQRQHTIIEEQHLLAVGQYRRDSLLHTRGVLSVADYERSQAEYLQSKYSLEGVSAGLENLKIQISQLEENLLDVQLQMLEKEKVMEQNIGTAQEILQNSLNSWMLNYNLKAPVNGTVTFTNYWSKNQFVTSGETVFYVIPDEEEQLLGIARLPLERSGKVEIGQRVMVRFANFPDHEFGIVVGRVSNISLVPERDFYRVEVELPDGLKTNYGKELPIYQEMKGTAEIVTAELRLIERFFLPVKRLLKEGVGE
ncbi:MAG: HlyD family efflux transporter periplasmic adaptor subunit [Bacteroides sp.]|nr:HlyD family efflux transporter periplasmic adaptor subunit [Bacteroides sp.]